jgi:hypothetical protein
VESHIEKGNEVSSVEIEEDPGTWYTWTGYLEPRQDEWKKIYGEQKGDRSRICGRSLMMNTRVGEKLARSL